jgi:hypothetical protein
MVSGLDYYHVIDHIARCLLLKPSKVILLILWLFKKQKNNFTKPLGQPLRHHESSIDLREKFQQIGHRLKLKNTI